MNTMNNGGPAFPDSVAIGPVGDVYGSTGMTLRDYLAAKALPVLIADASGADCDDRFAQARALSREAYEYADAMVAARQNDGVILTAAMRDQLVMSLRTTLKEALKYYDLAPDDLPEDEVARFNMACRQARAALTAAGAA